MFTNSRVVCDVSEERQGWLRREIDFDPKILEAEEAALPLVGDLGPEMVERIRDAVEALPEPERSVIECMVWGGERQIEVADRLGFSRSYVRRLFLRAQELLKESLGDLRV